MKMLNKLILPVFFWSIALAAQAKMYRYVDPATRAVLYSNVPIAPPPSAPPKAADETPALPQPAQTPPSSPAMSRHFPRVSRETQKERDAERRRILQDELQEELSALDHALSGRAKDEVIRRHKSNIAALQREMENTR